MCPGFRGVGALQSHATESPRSLEWPRVDGQVVATVQAARSCRLVLTTTARLPDQAGDVADAAMQDLCSAFGARTGGRSWGRRHLTRSKPCVERVGDLEVAVDDLGSRQVRSTQVCPFETGTAEAGWEQIPGHEKDRLHQGRLRRSRCRPPRRLTAERLTGSRPRAVSPSPTHRS